MIVGNLNKSDDNTKLEDYSIFVNEEKYKEALSDFIEELKDKAITAICKKHNARPSKNVHIDIDLISGFNNFKLDVYIEKIFIFRYRSMLSKSDYVSSLSAVSKEFYLFEYTYNNDFNKYLKSYKKPLSHIPKRFIDYYYSDGFNVYLNVNKKLEFETHNSILNKIRENIEYEDYTPYNEYLYAGIYYFKISSYLKKLIIDSSDLKRKIYFKFVKLF